MYNIDRQLEQQIVAMGLSLISTAMEASLREQTSSSSDVLKTASLAYREGKITKTQFVAVINALDEATYRTRAYAEPKGNTWNEQYKGADQYRR